MGRRIRLAVPAIALAGALLVPTGGETAAQDASADPEVLELAQDRGISLTQAQTLIAAQGRATELVDPLRAMLEPKAFGGVWIGDDDRVKVGIVAGRTDRTAVRPLSTAHGLDDLTDVVEVRHSMAAIEAGYGWLAEQVERVNRGAEWPLEVAQWVSANAVELGLPERGRLTAAQEQVVAQARTRLGQMLTISRYSGRATTATCEIARCDPPLRGGIRINPSNPADYCTLGFVARSRIRGSTYALTAGHCADSLWTVPQSIGSRRLSGVTVDVYDRRGDAQGIFVADPGAWRPEPWVFVANSNDTKIDRQYNIRADGRSVEGMRVCKTGATTGTSCGRVTRLNEQVEYQDGTIVDGLGRANFCVRKGDSGGPVYSNHTAYGMVSGVNNRNGRCRSYYQGIRGAENLLGMDLIFG